MSEHDSGAESGSGGYIAHLLAKIGYETDTAGLEKVHHSLERIKHVAEALFAIRILEGIHSLGERFASTGESLESAAIQTGLTTDALQKLQYAAAQNALSAEEMTGGLVRLNRQLFQAQKGSKQAQAVFASLGISPEQLAGFSNVEDAFYAVEDGINALGSQQQKVGAIMQLFGRGGAKYLKLISEGSEGTRQLGKRAQAVGAIISKESIENLAKFEDASASARLVLRNFLANFAGAFIPGITRGIRAVEEFFGKNKKAIVDGIAYVADQFGFWSYVAYLAFKEVAELIRRSLYGGDGLGGDIHKFIVGIKDAVVDNLKGITDAISGVSKNGALATVFDSFKGMLESLKNTGVAAIDAVTGLLQVMSGDKSSNLDKSTQRLTTILSILDSIIKLIDKAGVGWTYLFSGKVGDSFGELVDAQSEADDYQRRANAAENLKAAQKFSGRTGGFFGGLFDQMTGGLAGAGVMAGPGGMSAAIAGQPSTQSPPPVIVNSRVDVVAAPGMSEKQLATAIEQKQRQSTREIARDFASSWLW